MPTHDVTVPLTGSADEAESIQKELHDAGLVDATVRVCCGRVYACFKREAPTGEEAWRDVMLGVMGAGFMVDLPR
jgi:hypothetical protein